MALRSPLTVQPYDYISDSTGRPLDKGQIYIGVAGQDSEFYQIPVFLDAEMTKPIDQPIRTNDGFVDFAGSLSELYASGEIYSVKILDKEGRTVLYKGDMTRKNLMSDALADLNQSIIDMQTAAQITLNAAVNSANTEVAQTVSSATAAIDTATTKSNKAATDADAAIKTLFENGGLPATPFETKAQMTASPKADGTYAVVTNDTAANIGVYLKKSGAWTLVPWNNFGGLDSLKINTGKLYPLKHLIRGGIDKPSSQYWFDAILDVKVLNAKPDHYYQISYYANGDVRVSPDGNGWGVDRATKAAYETTGATISILNLRDPQRALATTGIDTIYLTTNDDETVIITVNTDMLPAKGVALKAQTNAHDGYSDIIDPSCYLYSPPKTGLDTLNSLSINSGKVYPLKHLTRGGVDNPTQQAWIDALLDITIANAEQGYYYQIDYFANGNTAFTTDGTGWSIYKFTSADFISNSNPTQIVSYTNKQTPLGAGISTIALTATTGEIISITLDKSKMPASGLAIKSGGNTQDGYNDIIDPSRYFYSVSGAPPSTPTSGAMSATLNSGTLALNYKSANKYYRLNFAPNGFNSLPNIVGFDVSDNGTSWTVINSGTTDWLPPLAAIADTGDGAALIYTGGNHGSTGSAGGSKTARNIYYDIKIDGKTASAFSGNCSRVEITIINEVMASNTITLSRYAIREAFKVLIVDGVITVDCQRTALEPLVIKTDNGLQSVSTGTNTNYLVLDGQAETRQPWADFNSGAKTSYPDAWAVTTQSAVSQLTSWMDRSYGVGDGSYVLDTSPMVRGGAGSSAKIYHAIVAGANAPLAKGASYKWRGGYHMKAVDEKPVSADSQFDAFQRVIAYSATDYMTV